MMHEHHQGSGAALSGLNELHRLRPRITGRVVDLLVRVGPSDRRTIAARLGISRPVLARAVTQLLDAGMLVESLPERPHQQRGRPTALLAVNPGAANAIGVHFGTRHVRVILVDAAHSVVAAREHRLPADYDVSAGVDAAVPVIDGLMAHATGPVIGVGVACPGAWCRGAHNLGRYARLGAGRASSNLVDQLTRRIHHPVVADEECRLAAYAEWHWGLHPKPESMVYLRLHSGVGGALIMQGRLVHGQHGMAGEFGHLGLSRRGHGGRCRCGNDGCLETIIGIPALLAASAPVLGPTATFEDLVRAVRVGEPTCVATVREAGREAGRVLATLCNAVDPACGIIGGALLRISNPLLDAIREGFDASALPAQRQLPLLAARLGRFVAARGATTLLFEAGLDALLQHSDRHQPSDALRRMAEPSPRGR